MSKHKSAYGFLTGARVGGWGVRGAAGGQNPLAAPFPGLTCPTRGDQGRHSGHLPGLLDLYCELLAGPRLAALLSDPIQVSPICWGPQPPAPVLTPLPELPLLT